MQKAIKNPKILKDENFFRELQTLDNYLQSQWEKIHGPDGLVKALVDDFRAMLELRLQTDLGDIVAFLCEDIRYLHDEHGKAYKWRSETIDWRTVAWKLSMEDDRARYERDHLLPHTEWIDKPWTREVEKAARMVNCSAELVKFEIVTYAERNATCHSGLKDMIKKKEWTSLAQYIYQTRRILQTTYQDVKRANCKVDWTDALDQVQAKFFNAIWVNEDDKVAYNLRPEYSPEAIQQPANQGSSSDQRQSSGTYSTMALPMSQSKSKGKAKHKGKYNRVFTDLSYSDSAYSEDLSGCPSPATGDNTIELRRAALEEKRKSIDEWVQTVIETDLGTDTEVLEARKEEGGYQNDC